MLSVRHKITGTAPMVNDFKDKAVVLSADLVLAPGETVDVEVPPYDHVKITRLLVALLGASDNVESMDEDEVDLFTLAVLPDDAAVSTVPWAVPHREALVLPVESSKTEYDITTLLEGFRVGNPSTVEGRVRLLVTT